MADIQGKYQKLATEYAKLRSQVPVLKKAVLDEQKKAEELKEAIKGKDQSIRKSEQEIDSLSFRNQQLSKRVLILQDELEDVEANLKKNKHKTSNFHATAAAPPIGGSVIGEELASKIEENARLHKQVFESDQSHRQVVTDLQDRLAVLEREASQHQEVLQSTAVTNKAQISKLQEEKAMLEVKLQTQEKDVKDAKYKANYAEEELYRVKTELGGQLSENSKIIRDKLPFNDTKFQEFNALNIPTHDRKHQLQAKELVGQAANLVRELVQGLSNFLTYSEQRSRIYPSDGVNDPLSEVNKKLCQFLHENASYLRPIDVAFKAFHETIKEDTLTTLETTTGLQGFADKFKRFVVFTNKLLPYLLLSIEEENRISSCPATLETKNLDVRESIRKFVAVLNKLETHVSLIAAQSETNCDHPRSNHGHMFRILSAALTDFHQASKDLSKHYNAKVSLEHQLPTATQKLKTTDECIVSSLISLVTCTGKLSTFLASNLDFFSQPAGFRTRGSSVSTSEAEAGPKCNPAVTGFRQRATGYMSMLGRANPDTVPYKVAVQNRKTLLSSTESRESLAQQVSVSHEKIGKLEQEKEHWMLESQLLQIKYEKEMQRVAEMEKLLKKEQAKQTGSIEDNLDVTTHPPLSPTPAANEVITTMLGQLENHACSNSDAEMREQLIKSHFSNRIQELTSQFQLADSKAVNFQAECRALHKRLHLAERNKDKLQEEVSTANQSIAQLKDELQTTTKSYEGQLSMMSEHLAGMNEKLAHQKDEIDALKLQMQMNAKAGKKGKR